MMLRREENREDRRDQLTKKEIRNGMLNDVRSEGARMHFQGFFRA